MKTLFVCSTKKINSHVGEEYDSILEVEDQPTTNTVQEWANRIAGRIRSLWHEQVKPSDPDHAVVNPGVAVHLDGPTPYHAILANLQIRMNAEEDIVVELLYLRSVNIEVTDRETLELLEKLDGQKR